MGGYAAYVWPAFLITAIVMVANLIAARRRHRAALAALKARVARTGSA